MLERTDVITNEVLELITFVLAYPTVYGKLGKSWNEASVICLKVTLTNIYLEELTQASQIFRPLYGGADMCWPDIRWTSFLVIYSSRTPTAASHNVAGSWEKQEPWSINSPLPLAVA